MNIAAVLDLPIAFQRSFVTVTGSVTAALMLSQAVYWQNRSTSEDGWWWKTQEDWEAETGLSRREQETARATLRALRHNDAALWHEERRGLPAKLYFSVDFDVLVGILDEHGLLRRADSEPVV